MAVNPDIHDRAYQFFIEEVPELLQAIEDGILMLRQDRSAHVVHEVMRAAHSIKGGSASVELEAIKDISHRLETAFRALYDESVEIDLELETLLLRGYDCLQRPLNEQMETGYHNPEQALITAIPILEAIEEKLGEEALSQADSFIPSSSDLGIDMVMSIFEIDVEQGIARLEEVAANPSGFPIAGELQTQAEVFVGFGELLDLPGFRAIAEAMTEAITRAPERAEEILQVALIDLQAARNAVMGGDRDQGGTPSEALLALAAGTSTGPSSQLSSDDSIAQASWDDLEEDFSLTDMDWGQDASSLFPMDMDAAALQQLLGETMNQMSEDAKPLAEAAEESSPVPTPVVPAAAPLVESPVDPWELPTEEISVSEMVASFQEAAIESGSLDLASVDLASVDLASVDLAPLEENAGDAADAAEVTDAANVEDVAEVDVEDVAELEDVADVEDMPEAVRAIAAQASEDIGFDAEAAADSLADLFGSDAAGEGLADWPDESWGNESSINQDLTGEGLTGESLTSEEFIPDNLVGTDSIGAQLLDIDATATWGQALDDADQSNELLHEGVDDLEASDVSALFGLEADSDMSPEADIFSQIHWQIDDSFDAQIETAIPEGFAAPEIDAVAQEDSTPQDFGSLEAFSLVDDAPPEAFEMLETQAIAPATTPIAAAESEDFSNLLDAFDLTPEAFELPADLLNPAPEAIPDSTLIQRNLPSPTDLTANTTHTAVEVALAERHANQPDLSRSTPPPNASLDAAVQAVEDLFEQLPAEAIGARGAIAEPEPSPATGPATHQTHPPAKTPSKESSHTAALSGISVRVDLSVLERMNNLVGELVLNRNSLSLQHDQLQVVVGQMSKRFKSFGDLVNGLQEASDQMLLQSNPSEGTTRHLLPSSQNQGEENLTAGFDSLEMDRYNGLHTQIQDIFEELMQLEEGVDDIDVLLEQTTQSISQQRQGLSRLQNELMWARMLPLDNILSRFPRVLRDLSAKHGKLVELNLVGTGVLVDKGILEKLHDPMLHLLRNAFDHGIEPPETRQQQGKPEQGTIEIRAFYQGNQTVIEIKDDGRGLNLEKIARRAVELGWMKREELRTIPQQVVADLIFEPNFSTASEVSELSGRGVGLDVVREQLKALKGTVSATSSPGEGTKFSLKLPLTLSVAKLMVCQVGPLAIALPSDAIEDLLVPEPKRIKLVAQQRFLHWRDDLIAIHPMAELLDYNCPLPDATSLKTLTDSTIPIPPDWAPPVLILKQGEQHFALEVNRLLMEQELVIKPFGNAATAPEYAYGCTILGDGQMIPVLDASALLGSLTQATSSFSGTGIHLGDETSIVTLEAPVAPPSMSSVAPARLSKTILVVDDSTAMRRTLALSLEKAGYRILQAGDGQEALEQLRQSSTIQLVICDVEMPTMNGFEFLSQRRREPELLKVPVVMLTSRSSDKHRRLALQLNANDYFSKPYVEQEFLKSIRAILDGAPTPSASPV